MIEEIMPEPGYNYKDVKHQLFTDEGQKYFLKVYDAAHHLLQYSGAFRWQELFNHVRATSDSFIMSACVDRLIELGEIVELPRQSWTQYKVYTTKQVHNL